MKHELFTNILLSSNVIKLLKLVKPLVMITALNLPKNNTIMLVYTTAN